MDKKPDKKSETNDHYNNLLVFAKLIKEVHEYDCNNNRPSKLALFANNYIKSLRSANSKVQVHHKYYKEIYRNYRPEILKSDECTNWLIDNQVEIHIGVEVEAFKRKNLILKISSAYSKAVGIQTEINKKKYKNDNEREIATGKYSYTYADEIMFRLLNIFFNCSESENKDKSVLMKCMKFFKSKTLIKSDSSDDSNNSSEGSEGSEETNSTSGEKNEKNEKNRKNGKNSKNGKNDRGAEALTKMAERVTGEKVSSSRQLEKVIEQVTSNNEMFESLEKVQKDMKKRGKMRKEDAGDIMRNLTEAITPVLVNMVDAFEESQKKDKKSEGSKKKNDPAMMKSEESGTETGSEESSE